MATECRDMERIKQNAYYIFFGTLIICMERKYCAYVTHGFAVFLEAKPGEKTETKEWVTEAHIPHVSMV